MWYQPFLHCWFDLFALISYIEHRLLLFDFNFTVLDPLLCILAIVVFLLALVSYRYVYGIEKHYCDSKSSSIQEDGIHHDMIHLKTLSGRITVTWVSTSVECIWYKTIEKSIISHQHRGQWIKLYTKLQTTMATLAERAIFYSDWIIINGFVMEIKHTVSIIRYGFRSSLLLTTIGCYLRMQGNRHIENALITLIREITGFGLVWMIRLKSELYYY